MSVPAAIVTTQAPRPWPAPIPRHRIQPNTRLQEEQYEITVPTVADRVAQTVAARRLEEKVEPIFHKDSYGYRPDRSALDAVAVCRKRCWEYDWGAPG